MNDDDGEFVPFVLSNYISSPVKVARIEAGLSRQELASRLQTTTAVVEALEQQEPSPAPARLEEILDAFSSEYNPRI